MEIKSFRGGYDHNFTYVLSSKKECCIIDPAVPADKVLSFIREKNLWVIFVIFLHSHFDHIIDLAVYRKEGIPIYGHSSTKIPVDRKLEDGDILAVGEIKIDVLHTPGHLYDCICLLTGKNLFTSDTIFVQGCGRIDFPGSDPEKMFYTIERMKRLPEDTIIYPGHDYGPTPTSTIGNEKHKNQFFRLSKEEFFKLY